MGAPIPLTTEATTVRYEFRYTTLETSLQTMFALGGIAEDVAMGIRDGLQGVPTITGVVAASVLEYREEVVLPPGPGGPPPPVQFDSASMVQFAKAGSGDWQHIIPDTSPGLLVLASFKPDPADPAITGGDYSVTCGGAALGSLGSVVEPINNFWCEAFVLLDAPGGDQTIGWDFPNQPNMTVRAQSLVYLNAAAFAFAAVTTGSDKATQVTVPSGADHMAAAIFAWDGSPVNGYTNPTQTERGNYWAGSMPGVQTQDAVGNISVPFGVTLISKTGWCALGVDVSPAASR